MAVEVVSLNIQKASYRQKIKGLWTYLVWESFLQRREKIGLRGV